MSFGERLQAVRRESGETQEEFAEHLKVSRQAVSKWESSKGYPEIEKILFICTRYGVTMDALFADELPARAPGEMPAETEVLRDRPLKTVLGNFFNNLSCILRVLLKINLKSLAHSFAHSTCNLAVAKFGLGLSLKLRFCNLN